MSPVSPPSTILAELCKTLGLEPELVMGIQFNFEVHDIFTANVIHIVKQDQAEEFVEVLKKYNVMLEESN